MFSIDLVGWMKFYVCNVCRHSKGLGFLFTHTTRISENEFSDIDFGGLERAESNRTAWTGGRSGM